MLLTSFTQLQVPPLFPLSQYDLPSHTPDLLSFSLPKGRHLRNSSVNPSPKPSSVSGGSTLESSLEDASDPAAKINISQEQIARNNPSVDYTRSVA